MPWPRLPAPKLQNWSSRTRTHWKVQCGPRQILNWQKAGRQAAGGMADKQVPSRQTRGTYSKCFDSTTHPLYLLLPAPALLMIYLNCKAKQLKEWATRSRGQFSDNLIELGLGKAPQSLTLSLYLSHFLVLLLSTSVSFLPTLASLRCISIL